MLRTVKFKQNGDIYIAELTEDEYFELTCLVLLENIDIEIIDILEERIEE